MPNEGHNKILDVLTTLTMNVDVFLGVSPCRLVARSPTFRMMVLS